KRSSNAPATDERAPAAARLSAAGLACCVCVWVTSRSLSLSAVGTLAPDDARAYLVKIGAEVQEQPRTDYTLAVGMAATSVVIGACNMTIYSQRFRSGEIGYFIHPDYWRQGYVTEAAQRLLRFGFGPLGLHRIIGQCDPRNTASAQLLERIGMRYEG